jgi:hypothetical protein
MAKSRVYDERGEAGARGEGDLVPGVGQRAGERDERVEWP